MFNSYFGVIFDYLHSKHNKNNMLSDNFVVWLCGEKAQENILTLHMFSNVMTDIAIALHLNTNILRVCLFDVTI